MFACPQPWRAICAANTRSLRIVSLCRLRNPYLLPGNERIGRTGDNGFLAGEAGNYLDLIPEITAQADGHEGGVIPVSDDGYTQTLRAEDQCVHGQNERWDVRRQLQMNLAISTGQELTVGIVNIHFDEERARVGGYRTGVPNQAAAEL